MQVLVLVFGQVTLQPILSQCCFTIAGSGIGDDVSSAIVSIVLIHLILQMVQNLSLHGITCENERSVARRGFPNFGAIRHSIILRLSSPSVLVAFKNRT